MRIKVCEYQTFYVETIVEAESIEAYEDGDFDFISDEQGDCVDCILDCVEPYKIVEG